MPPLKKPKNQDLLLLLSFLSDPNERTATLAREQLVAILNNYPASYDVLAKVSDPQLAPQAQRFLEESRLQGLLRAIKNLAEQGEALDLEYGVYLLASFAYPSYSWRTLREDLDAMVQVLAKAIRADAAQSLSQSAAVFRRGFTTLLGFHGNDTHYYDPDNSYINRVIERRTGIPISLSAIYLLLAKRLSLPAYGVGMPGHFIVAHADPAGPVFVDPFSQAKLLRREECVEQVRRRGLTFQPDFLGRTSPRQMLSRMIANLLTIYTEGGASERATWLSRFLQELQPV